MHIHRWRQIAIHCVLGGMLLTGCRSGRVPNSAPSGTALLISGATSLTDVLQEIGDAYRQENPTVTVRFNFAASGALQQQIEQGAPVDVFVSAGSKEMDALQQSENILPDTRTVFAGNRLVLITSLSGKMKAWSDLLAPDIRRIAVSNPASVPSGRYAQETLTKRNLWDALQKKMVLGENVRQTLTYVTNGDAEAGIVFATDARSVGDRIRVVAEALPGQDHQPIVYPAAIVRSTPNAASARKFLAFLRAPKVQALLQKYGFTRP